MARGARRKPAGAAHAREQTAKVRAAVDAGGAVRALALEIIEDFGAYCFYPANYLLRWWS